MAEHIWTVVCERHLVDPSSQIITLVDMIESIYEDGLELRLEEALGAGKRGAYLNLSMQLVSWWYRNDPQEERLNVRFTVLNPAGVSVIEQTAEPEWTGEAAHLRVFVLFEKFPVTMLGLHWFLVQHLKPAKKGEPKWERVTRIPLAVEPPRK